MARSECQGHGNIELCATLSSHWVRLSKSGFPSDVNWSYAGAVRLQRVRCRWILVSCPTTLLVRLSTCQTIGSNCPSGLGRFGAGHLGRERLMQGQLTGGSGGAAKFGLTIKLEARGGYQQCAPEFNTNTNFPCSIMGRFFGCNYGMVPQFSFYR